MSVKKLLGNEVSADAILAEALGELEDVLVIGWDKDGGQWISGNVDRGDELIWLLETCKATIMEQYVEQTD